MHQDARKGSRLELLIHPRPTSRAPGLLAVDPVRSVVEVLAEIAAYKRWANLKQPVALLLNSAFPNSS